MTYLLYIVFGLAPSIIWLLFFLRKDSHPESNRMILKIFFWGMLVTFPVFFIEIGVSEGLAKLKLPLTFLSILNLFIGVALVEEGLKYLVVRDKVLKDPEFDEPVDAMLYMIIAALGFAALENILVLPPTIFSQTIIISFLRFAGATFLHALASGVLGYFLALSFLKTGKRTRLIVFGLIIATLLHGLFNVSIIGIERGLTTQSFFLFFFSLISVIAILTGLGFFVSFGFRKLKRLKSICKIKT